MNENKYLNTAFVSDGSFIIVNARSCSFYSEWQKKKKNAGHQIQLWNTFLKETTIIHPHEILIQNICDTARTSPLKKNSHRALEKETQKNKPHDRRRCSWVYQSHTTWMLATNSELHWKSYILTYSQTVNLRKDSLITKAEIWKNHPQLVDGSHGILYH